MQACDSVHDARLARACQHCVVGWHRCMAASTPQDTCQGLGADDWSLGCHPIGQIGGRAGWRLKFLPHLHGDAQLGGRQPPWCLHAACRYISD